MANEFVQTMADARVDARSLSEFMYKPISSMVERRLAPSIHTLNYYVDLLDSVAINGEAQINQAIINSGFIIIDSFELGATITQRNEALRHTADSKLYRWAGDLPKVVPASSTPNTSGGSGANSWLEVSDTTLRQELAEPYAALSLANSVVRVPSVQDFNNIPEKGKFTKAAYLVDSFWEGKNTGGGVFIWDATALKSTHNGISIIDPNKVSQLGSVGTFGTYFTATASGTGVYKRVGVTTTALIEWAGADESMSDIAPCIQAVANHFKGIKVMTGRTYNQATSVTLKVNMTHISSHGSDSVYTGGLIRYTGNSTQFIVLASVNYLSVSGISLQGVPAVETDYFNTGSTLFDLTEGAVSIVFEKSWASGFEILFKGAGNSFYNKIHNNRLERFKHGLQHFSNNNLEIIGNRISRFNILLTYNGRDGQTTIRNNAFEVFNGRIVSSIGEEQGSIAFENNYVELYHTYDLPTNFPRSTGLFPDKFGHATLFNGYFSDLSVIRNHINLRGLFRMGIFVQCKSLVSKANNFTDYATGSSLTALYSTLEPYDIVDICDQPAIKEGVGPFTATYNMANAPVKKPFGLLNHIDAITGKSTIMASNKSGLGVLNGWTSTASYGSLVVFVFEHGVTLNGVVDGTAKTSNIISIIPEPLRPKELIKDKLFAVLTTTTALGSGENVGIKYDYETGELSLLGAPTNLTGICLDGLVIPNRL